MTENQNQNTFIIPKEIMYMIEKKYKVKDKEISKKKVKLKRKSRSNSVNRLYAG